MASPDAWRSALTASERFSNIQKIEGVARPAGAAAASAFTRENEAYLSSTSREAYDAACARLAMQPDEAAGDGATSGPGSPARGGAERSKGTESDADDDDDDDEGGIRIGPYRNCRYVASGASADVYRSGGVALKVVTSGSGPPPHNAHREAKMLKRLQPPCIPLQATLHDQAQRLVLVFPFMPLSLEAVLHQDGGGAGAGALLSRPRLLRHFADVLRALAQIHSQGMVHRDVKPSAVLLASADGPAYLSDFGTAWDPALSRGDEPADGKVLDVGTGPYRAPEVLFGHQGYGAGVDLWSTGAMLAECARGPPHAPLFASRPAHEDGSQLGLILSIFQTLGTPTRATWPEAAAFRTPPFDMYRAFPPRPWAAVLPDVDADLRALVAGLVRYDSTRLTAEQALAAVTKLAAA